MTRRKIGTFEDLLALDPKEWKFSRVLSSDESRKAIEESKREEPKRPTMFLVRDNSKATKKPQPKSLKDLL